MRILGRPLTRLALAGAFLAPVMLNGGSNLVQAHRAAATITITVAFQEQGPAAGFQNLKWWNSIIPAIEAANPGIKIKTQVIVASEGDYYTKVDLMLRSASTAPDLVKEDSFLIGSDATAGYLTPLNKYLATWPEYKVQWYPGMQAITTFKGTNYGVMNGTDVRGIWYNKHVFAKAGLPTNWQPHNWADILSAARTIKAKLPGVVPINVYSGIPMDEASALQGFQMLLYGTKDSLYDYKTNKWIASSPGFLDSLKFLQTVYDPDAKKLLGPTSDIALNGLAWSTIQLQLLPKDKLGIDLDGSWVPNAWAPTGAAPWPQWQSVMGMAKMPTEFGQAPGYISMSGGWSYAISSKSPNKDAAFKVLQAANSAANLASFDVLDGQIATRKDVVSVPAYGNVPMNPFFTSLVAFSQFRAGFPAYPKISNEIQLATQLMMYGGNGTTAAAAMSGFKDAVKGIVGAANVESR